MRRFAPIPQETELVAREDVDAAFKVHKSLSPGLLESAYEACMVHELRKLHLTVECQVVLPVVYDGVRVDAGFRPDLVVENQLIIELKAVEKMVPLYDAQLMTYLKLTGKRVGLLINFNVSLIKNGIKRVVL